MSFSVVLKSPFSGGLYPPLVYMCLFTVVWKSQCMDNYTTSGELQTANLMCVCTWLFCYYCGSSVQCTCTWCKHMHHGTCACMHIGWYIYMGIDIKSHTVWDAMCYMVRHRVREICVERLWDGCHIFAQVSHTQMITSKALHPCDKQGVHQGTMQHTHMAAWKCIPSNST